MGNHNKIKKYNSEYGNNNNNNNKNIIIVIIIINVIVVSPAVGVVIVVVVVAAVVVIHCHKYMHLMTDSKWVKKVLSGTILLYFCCHFTMAT